jgi:hypothetical protein
MPISLPDKFFLYLKAGHKHNKVQKCLQISLNFLFDTIRINTFSKFLIFFKLIWFSVQRFHAVLFHVLMDIILSHFPLIFLSFQSSSSFLIDFFYSKNQ